MEKIVYSFIYIFGVFISSFSQMLLKKSSLNNKQIGIREYLNPIVISAYFFFFLCTFLSIFALKIIPLSLGAAYEALGYIFVPLLGFFLFKETLTGKQLLGIGFIISGIIIYSLF
jgi:multidrug transporter EmrE-like cation transporter